MSWVTNVLLLYDAGEEYGELEDGEESGIDFLGPSPSVQSINDWLKNHGWTELVDLADLEARHCEMDRHGFECGVWGAAINHLDIESFLRCVRSQPWREPENVQLAIKDQEEPRFTFYNVQEISN